MSKTFVETGESSANKKRSNQEKDEFMFANGEEEFFYEKAILKSSYSVQEQSNTGLGGHWSDDIPTKPLSRGMITQVIRGPRSWVNPKNICLSSLVATDRTELVFVKLSRKLSGNLPKNPRLH